MRLNVVDGHAHLDELTDVHGAIARSRRLGVKAIVAVSTCKESSLKTFKLSKAYPGYVYPAVGLHPWDLETLDLDEELYFLDQASRRCVAIGEVGLDYKVKTDRSLQRRVFEETLSLASERGVPVIVHARAAWKDAYTMVKERGLEKAVFHWFSGSDSILRKILRDGYFISATPAASYSAAHRKAVKLAPVNHILVESDCPVAYRSQVSDPSWTVKSLKAVAEIKGLNPEEVADKILSNTLQLYRIRI